MVAASFGFWFQFDFSFRFWFYNRFVFSFIHFFLVSGFFLPRREGGDGDGVHDVRKEVI